LTFPAKPVALGTGTHSQTWTIAYSTGKEKRLIAAEK